MSSITDYTMPDSGVTKEKLNGESKQLGYWLGYTGAIPFYLSALAIWFTPWVELASQGLLAYGAVILTFIGALHWGRVIMNHHGVPAWRLTLAFSVLPALLAWITLLLPATSALPLQISGFMLVCWFEGKHQAQVMSPWFRGMRQRLTWIVSLGLLLGWSGLLVG